MLQSDQNLPRGLTSDSQSTQSPQYESRTSGLYVPKLRQGEHVVLTGATGTGKTTLAEAFLSRMPWVVVLDFKWELKWRAFQVSPSLLGALSHSERRLIFRPRNPEDAAKAIDALFNQGGWTIFVDEVYGLSKRGNSQSYPEAYIRALTRGRSRGITVWSGMQRPAMAPWFAFTEAVHYFMFHLAHSDDRKRVGKYTTEGVAEAIPTERRYFNYWSRLEPGKLIQSKPLRKDVR